MASNAGAEPLRAVRLDYDAPTGGACPSREELRASVATRLGFDPFDEEGAAKVSAVIVRKARAFHGDVELFGDDGASLGARSLSGDSCAELATSMAFAISMAIDPVRALGAKTVPSPTPSPALSAPTMDPSEPQAPPLTGSTPTTGPPVAPPEHNDTDLTRRSSFVPQVHASIGLGGLGLVAGVAPSLAIGGGVRHGAAALELEGRVLLPSSERVDGGAVRTSSVGVSVLPCAHVGPAFFCASVTAGALQGEALEIEAPMKASSFFAQAGVRVGGSIDLHPRATLEPFVETLATLTRTGLTFHGHEVWSTTSLGAHGGLRVAIHFP